MQYWNDGESAVGLRRLQETTKFSRRKRLAGQYVLALVTLFGEPFQFD